LTYLFIAHNLSVVEHISDRVAVMYLGQIVEMGTHHQVFGNPQHPYTRRLIDAVPVPDPAHRRKSSPRLSAETPSPLHLPGREPPRVVLKDIGGGHL
ncbi:MAG: oligopeptide/dipeptide ABC transporter ATP-binding protein, partial [Caldilinea sp.]